MALKPTTVNCVCSAHTETLTCRHLDIFVYRAAEQRIESIETAGSWLGLFEKIDSVFTNRSFAIHPHDVVLLYTDGITELPMNAEELFGEERLIERFH